VPPAAQAFARDLADNTSAVSVAATKALVYGAFERGRRAAHEEEHEVFRWTGRQADVAEGVTAFLEKRAAVAAVQNQGLSADAVRKARGAA
jgi:enoyl-CoA hydratase/carnithine racemase